MKLSSVKKLALKDKMMFGAGVMSIGIFIGSLFNYLTQVFLGRFLSVEDYGTFNSLFSLTVILGIPIASLGFSLIKVSIELRNKEEFGILTSIFIKITKSLVVVGTLLAFLVIIFKDIILNYLNIEQTVLIYPFAFYLILLLISAVPKSYLQGLLRYKAFSFQAVLGPMSRLFLSILFVIAGFKILGAFYGLILATIFNYFIGVLLTKKNFNTNFSNNVDKYYSKLFSFGVAVFMIRASLTSMSSMDLILVKHFFSSLDAGIYAGIVTIGKIILFGTGIIGVVMFPIISDLYEKGTNIKNRFYIFLGLELVAVILGILLFSSFPGRIVLGMFGKGYVPAIKYVSSFVIYVGLYSIINFLFQFLMAVEETKAFSILVFGVIAQFILINLIHGNLYQIININIFVMLMVLITTSIYLKVKVFR